MGHSKLVIPVMHCFDNNYVVPAGVSFYSMLEHANPKYHYTLYVLHTDITYQNREALKRIVSNFEYANLEFINMQGKFEEIWDQLKATCNNTGYYSKEVLYKLLVASVFPQYEKIVITDVDVVFLGDISESYLSFDETKNKYFAGIRQNMPQNTFLSDYYKNYDEHFGPKSAQNLKICGGYLIANLNQLRKNSMEERFLEFLRLNSYRLLQQEQDVINFVCADHDIAYLPLSNLVCTYLYDIYETTEDFPIDPYYSIQEIREAMNHPIQLHYATGTKPWNSPASTKADIWYLYLAKCGLFFDFIKKQQELQKTFIGNITREDIRKGEPENRSPIMISVLCCTYNHKEFIRKTLDGILGQHTEFIYELIVSDDASTDGTQEIIREYQIKYPILMQKTILREKNVGIGQNYYEALKQVSGRFLAICDGDDEWIDPYKLQKQAEFLLNNHDCTVCCSSFITRNAQTTDCSDNTFDVNNYIKTMMTVKDRYNLVDYLKCRFIASCTVMLRWQLRNRVPEFLKEYSVIDFPLILIHVACGSIAVLNDEVFSRYNTHGGGITSQKQEAVRLQTFCLLHEVNQLVDYRLVHPITNYINEVKQYEYSKYKVTIPNKKSEIIDISQQFPLMHRIYRKFVPESIKRIYRYFKRIGSTLNTARKGYCNESSK